MGGATKSFKKIASGDISGVADLGLQTVSGGQLSTNGFKDGELGKVKGLNNLFSGKKKKYSKDALADSVNKAGAMGLDNLMGGANELNKVYANPQETITNQIGLENKLLRGASDDAMRRTRQLMAQRGMGSSSIGLGQEVNINRDAADKMAMNSASGMERLMNLNKDRMNMGNTLLAPKYAQGPMQMNTIKKREGGITGEGGLLQMAAPFAGAVGSYYGAKGNGG
jgi:hypothetical protein